MRRRRLKEAIIIEELNVFGFPSQVKFLPYDKVGWFWRTKSGIITPIDSNLVIPRFKCLSLKTGKDRINIIEHILALKYAGFSGVIIQGNNFLPYRGRSLEFLEEFNKSSYEADDSVPWVTVAKSFRGSRGNRYVEISPLYEPRLEVKIIIDYPGIGAGEYQYNVPDDNLAEIFKAYALALNYRSKLFYHLFRLWPHHKKVIWPQKTSGSKKEVLKLIADHRLIDLLGFLAALKHNSLVGGKITSYYGGHAIDCLLLEEIKEFVPVAK